MEKETPVTDLLVRIRDGDDSAVEMLLPRVYGELRALAGAVFGRPGREHTLQPTALVHEAWMKMADSVDRLNNSRHFFAVASRAMRQVLADHARAAQAEKRGGGATIVALADDAAAASNAPGLDLIAFHEALTKLETLNERHARIVELRLLGALTIAETADVLGVSTTTVETDWAIARGWLRGELGSR